MNLYFCFSSSFQYNSIVIDSNLFLDIFLNYINLQNLNRQQQPQFVSLMTTQQVCHFFFFFLVIASTTTYTYSSANWRKSNNGNLTIIDQYIPQGEGVISHFEAKFNKLKFSMEGNENSDKNHASISVYAYLPPFPFDGSKITQCRFQNIPIKLQIYLRFPSNHILNQMPKEIVIKQITFEFSQANIVFYLQGSTYSLGLTVKASINDPLWIIIIFMFTIMTQLINVLLFPTKGMLRYRFLTLFNTMSSYKFFILMRSYKLEQIEQIYAQPLLKLICFGSLLSLVVFILSSPVCWKKTLVAFALLAYSTLIALGYIGQVFVLTEIFVQQAIITSKCLAKQYPEYFFLSINFRDYFRLVFTFIFATSVLQLLLIGMQNILFQLSFDYGYFYLCLILLLLITNESCLMKNPVIIMNLKARLRRTKYYKLRIDEENLQQLS